jgi:anhydro-N-acetylmuramic acid kinase
VQNIGGIANLTAILAGAPPEKTIAFDTGPGNMVMDALSAKLLHRPYDRGGQMAASGRVLEEVVRQELKSNFFRQSPPKTAGREQFGRDYSAQFLHRCGHASKADVLATATALTARSIALAVRRFARPRGTFHELIVAGGGVRNATLMAMLANELRPMKIALRSSDEFGIPVDAKEAVAFALLAFQTWNRQPSNLPSATGASRPAVLGKVSYG